MRNDFGIMRFVVGFIVIAVLVLFGILLFRGNNNDNSSTSEPRDVNVTEYASRNPDIIMTIDGEINGEETHRKIRVTVNRNERVLEIIRGYDNDVIQTQRFPNTGEAFEAFTYALHNEGYGNARKVAQEDVRGVCPDGRRVIFEIREGFDEISNLWSTTCSRKLGTLSGNRANIESLFKDQITDFNQLTSDVQL